ncbi:MAG: phytoene desaturase family protein [Cytophagales bacterium]|nr:phytoene desaturase family protein [Cytophagales bacterium]MDW8384135.1 phytoene desaturase family protein [Flammeovirgaceae bacterium]
MEQKTVNKIVKKVIVIGAGFAGISAATSLAHRGYKVTVLEKHPVPGGRGRYFRENGFHYDMGPSWYWMPDVFESYFAQFGKKVSDYYELIRLNPSYAVIFGENDIWHIPASLSEFEALLEQHEKGASQKLKNFLEQSAYKYEVGIKKLVYKPSRSIREFLDARLLYDILRMDIFKSFSSHIRKYFHHEKILKLMEFPVLFLGATPRNTPALYSLMNYADIALGTWYPMGGMYKIVEGMCKLAQEKGVNFYFNIEVQKFYLQNNQITHVKTSQGDFEGEIIISGADYHHTEMELLPTEYRSYSEKYWNSRVMAPSCLIFYLGINKKLKNLLHHNLFFDEDFSLHAEEIYTTPRWPSKPLFYVSVPSITDKSVAPEGCENVFILIPVAHSLQDDDQIREQYYHIVMERLERLTQQSIRDHVIFKKSYAHTNFINDYHAFKGNAYGLANTLMQTAIFKPSLKSKKVKNLYYTGQLTVPGPGVPPSLISGIVVANEVAKEFPY